MLRSSAPSQSIPVASRFRKTVRSLPKFRSAPKSRNGQKQRILALYSGLLLDELILGMLNDEAGLQVATIRVAQEEAIAQQILSLRPDMVILCKTAWFSVEKLKQILASLHYQEAVQFFTIAMNDNFLEVSGENQLTFSNFRSFVNSLIVP